MHVPTSRLIHTATLALVLSLVPTECSDVHETSSDNHAAEAVRHDEENHREGHEGKDIVRLSPQVMRELDIEVRTARPGMIALHRKLPGEVVSNPDRVTHIVPRVSGVVAEVRVTVGDRVEKDQFMAMLVSRELAQTKSSYLAALSQTKLPRLTSSVQRSCVSRILPLKLNTSQPSSPCVKRRLMCDWLSRELYVLVLSEEALRVLPE